MHEDRRLALIRSSRPLTTWRGASRFSRPVLVVSDDEFNRSRIDTVIVLSITSNLRLKRAPGNIALPASESGLPKDSVVNVSQVMTIDGGVLLDRAGNISDELLAAVDNGLRLVLGL